VHSAAGAFDIQIENCRMVNESVDSGQRHGRVWRVDSAVAFARGGDLPFAAPYAKVINADEAGFAKVALFRDSRLRSLQTAMSYVWRTSELKSYSHGIEPRRLSTFEVVFLASKLAKGLPPNQPLVGEIVDPAYEEDVRLMHLPTRRVAKMARKQHVDAFFNDGTLRLGTYEDFRTQGNAEVRDHQEGLATVVGVGSSITAFGTYQRADDSYIFCTFLGNPDANVIEQFGYDDQFFIDDIAGFCSAIKEPIGATSVSFGTCVYCEYKVLVGSLDPMFNPTRIDHRTAELAGEATHYVKPVRYSHQNEFRMVWRMRRSVSKPVIIKCPEAIQFCSRG
jgi:hypothetical protein